MPDEPEAAGLLALMTLHDARRPARLDEAGELVSLEDQDRSRWDTTRIASADVLLRRALRRGRPGPYQIQAAIAAVHATAPTAPDTDWTEIAGLYAELAKLTPSPVVELNRAVAIAMADGPQAGLALVDRLAATGTLSGYYLLHATRADLLRRLNRRREAISAYDEALALTISDPERRYLLRRRAEMARP
jgi:RNA polymerase sigma-70 factor (ECF subfamily)